MTVTLYTGSSLTNPQAGTGLSRIVSSTNSVAITGAAGSIQTIPLANPVDLLVGQVFYGAALIRGVPGTLFPFSSDAGETPVVTPLGHSFFDVGPTQGAAYDLDVTTNATVLGGSNPVVTFAQSAGDLGLRVTANAVPEPSSMILTTLGVGLLARRLRRKKA